MVVDMLKERCLGKLLEQLVVTNPIIVGRCQFTFQVNRAIDRLNAIDLPVPLIVDHVR
jgi:hypothetical protein